MAGPPRRLPIRALLEGQPSLTFALGLSMTTVRKVSLAAVAIVVVLPLAIVVSTIAVIRSCSDDGQRLPMGEDQSWLSARAARKLCEEFLSKQGYTNAQLESETAIMQKSWYKF